MSVSRRSRAVFILDYLKKNSDEEHPVDTAELLQELEKEGLVAERKAIYEDIKALCDLGHDIIKTNAQGRGYFIGSREFEIPEVSLLIDAVQSAGFISPSKTKKLISKLEGLLSKNQAENYCDRVFIENRSKCTNEGIYRIISDINEAIKRNKQIEITYSKNTLSGDKLTVENKEMVINPYALLWDSDHYYLIGNNVKYDNLTHLRVDRISKIRVVNKQRRHFSEVSEYKYRFDVADYARKTFNMFGGELCRIDLECDIKLLDQIIDRFGSEIFLRHFDGEKSFRFSTDALISEGLVGWLMQFGGRVKVLSPKSLKEDVLNRIRELEKSYQE